MKIISSLHCGRTGLAGAALLVLSALPASSDLVVDFNDLSLGQLEGQAAGTGLSGSWTGNVHNAVVAGNLDGPAVSASLIHPQSGTAQSVAVSSSSAYTNSQTRIALATPLTNVTWVSFVVELAANYRIGLGFNSTGVHTDSDVDGNFFFNAGQTALQVRRNPNQGATTTGSTSLTGLGTNFFVVARMDTAATNSNINVWLNPGSLAAFSGAPTIADASINFTGDQLSGFSVLGFNSASRIDNIRIGNELSDVVVIPEPGTLGLLVGGAMISMLARRRLLRPGARSNPI